jgi:hypothetical protein
MKKLQRTGPFVYHCRCGAVVEVHWHVPDLERVRLCAPPPVACIICGGDLSPGNNPNISFHVPVTEIHSKV